MSDSELAPRPILGVRQAIAVLEGAPTPGRAIPRASIARPARRGPSPWTRYVRRFARGEPPRLTEDRD